MRAKEILKRIRERNFDIFLNGNNLQITSDVLEVPQDLIEEVRNYKQDIIDYLKKDRSVISGSKPIPKTDSNAGGYLLSSSQKRLWVLSRLEEGSVAYNLSGLYLLEGALDPQALAYSFNKVIGRHEILRTVFTETEAEDVLQVVLPVSESGFSLTYLDLRNEASNEEKIASIVQTAHRQPFDLARGPLLRASLCRMEKEKWILNYALHHIITDGTSMNILIREVMLFYNAYIRKQNDHLPHLRVQYKDYSHWQQQRLRDPEMDVHRRYWLSRLSGELPVLDLVGSKPRPAIKTFNGESVCIRMNGRLSNGLRMRSRENGATLFMGLLAAVHVLLFRYTQQEDIIIGSPISGRDHADLENQLGFYVNMLVLRTQFGAHGTYDELLAVIRDELLEAYQHQSYPLDELLEELTLTRDRSRNPLFDVIVALQNTAMDTVGPEAPDGLTVSRYATGDNGQSKFDLEFHFMEIGEEIELYLVYNSDLYAKREVERMARQLERLVESILTERGKQVGALQLLNDDDRFTLLQEWSGVGGVYEENRGVVAVFTEQVMRSPEKVAVVCGNRQLTYAELDERSNCLAAYLIQNHGIKSEEFVGVMLGQSELLPIAILGIWKAGGVYVPIDPDERETRRHYIIKDAGLRVLVTEVACMAGINGVDTLEILDIQEAIRGTEKVEVPVRGSGEFPSYVMYTSGSTGAPKGVVANHRGIVRLAKSPDYIRLTGNEVLLSTGAITFDATVFEYWSMLLNGGQLVLCSKEVLLDMSALHEYMLIHKVDTMWFTAGWLNELIDRDLSLFAGLRTVLAGGDVLSPVHIGKLLAAYPELTVINGYGPTENTTFSLTWRVAPPIQNIPVGRPIGGSTVYILDDRMQLMPIGGVGEICVGGLGLVRGYLHEETLTRQKFVDHPFETGQLLYRTGDLGRWSEDGVVEFIGRKDNQVKIRGYRVEPNEIESVLQRYPDMGQVVVIPVAGANGEKELACYITGNSEIEMVELRRYAVKHLPAYMLPARYVRVEQLPLTATGKVNRKLLSSLNGQEVDGGGVIYEAPRTQTEEILIKIWQDILGRERVGIRDDFFGIGGHSLKVTRLASRIYKTWGIKIGIRELFANPVLLDQAKLIDQTGSTGYDEIRPVEKQEQYVLSSAQRRLWVLSQLEEASIAYNILSVHMLDGVVNEEALEWCFRELFRRHESLRTVFRMDNGKEVRQFILSEDELSFRVERIDLMGLEQPEEQLRQSIAEEASKPFSLTDGPLLRATLYRTHAERRVLTYTLHHIIGDGWSMQIIMEELLLLYEARCEGGSNPLQPLRIQYRDYASWQQQNLRGEEMDRHRKYWQELLSGELPVLELPGDRCRPAVKTYRGGSVGIRIGAGQLSAFYALCQEAGCTLFMGLLGLVKTLLYRYTGQQDIIIGSPIAGREHADLEGQIGFYVNMLALRSKLKGEDNFRNVLAKMREVTLGAYEHQAYPFDELVDELWQSGDMSRQAFFDVVLVLQNQSRVGGVHIAEEPEQVKVRGYGDSRRVVSLFDLRLDITERENGLDVIIEYNSDMYERDRIVRMGDHLQRLLEKVVNDPAVAISRLSYLEEGEVMRLLGEEQSGEEEQTLVNLFEAQVVNTPGAIAVTIGDRQITYRQLNEEANQVAHFLVNKAGLGKEGGVGLLMERNAESIATMLGVLKAGGYYIPMDVEAPEERLRYIMRDTGAGILITEKRYIELANRLQWSIPGLGCYLCIDSDAVLEEKEERENLMMDQELWDHVGESTTDAISGGGWKSSFTGQPLSEAEMEEYAMNAYQKVSGYLHPGARVLEIGCSSGLTMRKVAPEVGYYYGTDLSAVIVEKTGRMAEDRGWKHVHVQCMPAHEIAGLKEQGFDLIILNSVIQHFHGHNYLRKVLRDAVALLGDRGVIFVGDVMDIERKEELVRDLESFKAANKGNGFVTKTDLSAELFVSKGFFTDLGAEIAGIKCVEASDKIYTLDNELTRYRYDVIMEVDKNGSQEKKKKAKLQYGRPEIVAMERKNINLLIPSNNLAYAIYTSGTTGHPKGVLIEHRNVVALLKSCGKVMDIRSADVWTMFHSYGFDFSVWEMYGALANGGRLVLLPRSTAQDPDSFLSLLERERVTILNQTPSSFYQLDRTEQDTGRRASNIRYVIFGGESLETGRLGPSQARHPGVKLINMYGITETTVHVTYKEIGEEEIKQGGSPIGRPLPGWRCYILDEQGELQPEGIPGELYVGGNGVGRGYLNQPELTAQRFVEDPFRPGERVYRSGDKAVMKAGGVMEYMGRIDDQVKVRGYRIELGEINQSLAGYEGIEASVVAAVENREREKELTAYLVSGSPVDIQELRRYLSKTLPSYMLPQHYVALKELPLTTNGKVDKKRLPSPEGLYAESGVGYVAARNETEAGLVRIWQEILGKKGIGVKDDFFELGGHSLKATRLSSQIHREFNVKLSLRELFEHPVLEEQALLIGLQLRVAFESIPVLPERPDYVLSSAQRRLYILSQFPQSNRAYTIAGVYLLEGQLEEAALSSCFRQLISRHEALRTVFREDVHGEVRQQILPAWGKEWTIVCKDLRGREDELRTCIDEEKQKPFDLAAGPLFRAVLYRTGEERWVFFYAMHHIVSDGWSMNILFRELLSSYTVYAEEQQQAPVPLRIQYKDYAAWQQQQLKGGVLSDARLYWLNQFANELPVLELRGNRPRPALRSYRGGQVSFEIDEKLKNKLYLLAQEQSGTLFMGLLAVVNVLLYRYTAQEDIIIGTPIAGREHADLSDQIGCYLNSLALRTRFNGDDSFRKVLSIVKDVTMGAYEHQGYPFDELIDGLDLPRDLSRNPLFDVMVILQNNETVDLPDLKGLQVSGYDGGAPSFSKFDLTFEFKEAGTSLRCNIEYNGDLFNREAASGIGMHLEQLLKAILADADLPVNRLDYLNAAEKHKLLEEFNATDKESPGNQTLVQLFEAQAAKTPDKTAIISGEREISFRQLNESSSQLALYLRDRYDIRPNDLVGIMLERSEWLVISILGVLKAGGAYVPVDPEYPAARIEYILSDSHCKAVINEQELERFREEATGYGERKPEGLNGPDDLAYVIYTSGSTGLPKGVMINHGSVVSFFENFSTRFFATSEMIAGATTNITFDISVLELLGCLSHGMKLVMLSDRNMTDVANQVKRYNINFLQLTPSRLEQLLEANDDDLSVIEGLKLLLVGGEPMSKTAWSRLKDLNTEVVNVYGPTETTIWSTSLALRNSSSLSIGQPLFNEQILILDKLQQLLPVGAVGEICIGGSGLARGYLNRAELTAEKFIPHPFRSGSRLYRTGDLGRWTEEGTVEFVGRIDDQVKVRGYRIEPGEIEQVIQTHGAVASAVVQVEASQQGEGELVAYLVNKEPITIGEIRQHLSKALPVYMLPDRYVQLDQWPLTTSGKIDKKALATLGGIELGVGHEYVAPRTDIENYLVKLWQEILGKPVIGITDDFFHLGGNSLRSMRVINHIKRKFGIEINVRDIFIDPTIEAIAAAIDAHMWIKDDKQTQDNPDVETLTF